MRRPAVTAKEFLTYGVTFSARKAVKRAVEDGLMDPSVENAIRELWNAIQDAPIALVDQSTGQAITFAQFASIGTYRTAKKLEKLTRRVKKTAKGLADFIDIGGSIKAIESEINAEGNRSAKRKGEREAPKVLSR